MPERYKMSYERATHDTADAIDARRKQIRKTWTDSERTLRELQASIAQFRLALALVFRDWSSTQNQ